MMQRSPFPTAMLTALVLVSGVASAAARKPRQTRDRAPEPVAELTETGRRLEASYAKMLNELSAEVLRELPGIDEARKAAWLAALKAEAGPAKDAAATARTVGTLKAREGKLRSLKYRATFVPKMLADADARLKRAEAMPDSDPGKAEAIEYAKGKISLRQEDAGRYPGDIKKAEAELKEARAALPAAIKEAEAAAEAYAQARASTWKAMDAMGLRSALESGKLDGPLASCVILSEATPRRLAEFAQQGPEKEKLIEQLFSDTPLMIQMLVADGPFWGQYGPAMEIYTAIQKASSRAREGLFQRLALAVSLEHAIPIKQRNAPPLTDNAPAYVEQVKRYLSREAPEYIDPVQRYLSCEGWYLDGELGPAFKDHSVWNLAMVVDGKDPDEIFAWGRHMLRNLRPDHVPTDGDTSRYVNVVDTEITYSSKGVKDDDPKLQFMQNILANGGVCGRRAFFGRFVLRAFGVPTTARKEPGHATLAHWAPDGWKTRLGGRWGGRGGRGRATMNRARSGPYGSDLDFLANTQAREDTTAFLRVKRAQWIGAVVGEQRVLGFRSKNKPGFWYHLALHEQDRIIAELKAKAATAVRPAEAVVADGDADAEKITVDGKGVITIPAAACSNPTESTNNLFKGQLRDGIVFMESNLGGRQLHLARYSRISDTFEYTFDAPRAGKYQLTAKAVTPKPDQRLFVSANGTKEVVMALPYTVGMWGKTEPVEIELVRDRNVLKFFGPARVSVKTFTLTPADGRH